MALNYDHIEGIKKCILEVSLSLSANLSVEHINLDPIDNDRLAMLCGPFNEHLNIIENRLHVSIYQRGHALHVSGEPSAVLSAKFALEQLYNETLEEPFLSQETINAILNEARQAHITADIPKPSQSGNVYIKTRNLLVKPRGENQKHYVELIRNHDIVFGVGPAGTGKTYLAVAEAVSCLERGDVERIIITRPAVEAGERLGFLPGDLTQKVDPYLRPIYDALFDMIGTETVSKLLEKNILEIAPLAFMRGRTLNQAFVILDESQNTTPEQMKMFLTRVGMGSKAVVTGDLTQIDLPKSQRSGLRDALQVLSSVDEIGVCHFKKHDVVRHHLVQKVVAAYESFQEN